MSSGKIEMKQPQIPGLFIWDDLSRQTIQTQTSRSIPSGMTFPNPIANPKHLFYLHNLYALLNRCAIIQIE